MEGETSAKTYVFGNDNGYLPLLVSMFNQRGLDPSVLYALNNNGGIGGNSVLWILFLLFFWGGNGNWGGGFGNNSTAGFLSNQISNDAGRDLLLQAIQGNSTALGQLASTLNSDFNAVQSGITSLLTAIQSVGSQVGMSGLQVKNAIESGNAALSRQLCECCCNMRQQVSEQGYQNQLRTVEQTNQLGTAISGSGQRTVDAIADLKATMIEQFCNAEKRDMQSEINRQGDIITQLRGQIDNDRQTNQLYGVIAPLQAKVNEIANKQPNTVPIQWPNLTAVNTTPYMGYGAGFNPYGYGWGGNSYWG